MIHIFGKVDCVRCTNIKERLEQSGLKYEYHDLRYVSNREDHVPPRHYVLAICAFSDVDHTAVPFGICNDEAMDYIALNKFIKGVVYAAKNGK